MRCAAPARSRAARPSRRQEQLDAQDADDVERLERRARDGSARHARPAAARRAGAIDTSRMWSRVRVLDDAVVDAICPSTPRAATTDSSRSKIDERLEHRLLAADRRPRRRARRSAPVDARLALAVVAEARGLEDGRRADAAASAALSSSSAAHRREGRRRESRACAGSSFSRAAVLRDVQHRAGRAAPASRSAIAATLADGTFSNSKVTTSTPSRERAQRVEVVVVADDLDVGDLAGRGSPRRARTCGRDSPARRAAMREHASELAAAEDADRRARAGSRARRASLAASPRGPPALRASRHACSAVAQAGSRVRQDRRRREGRRWSRRPRRSPGSPPARRPASGRSRAASRGPDSALLWTGTPSTGSSRHRGHHPGQVRGAAGAGDDHLEAARFGVAGVLDHPAPACGAPRPRGTRAPRRTASGRRPPASSSPSPIGCP